MVKTLPLVPRPVAEFYAEVMEMLRSAGIEVKIWRMPVEIPDPIAFDQDQVMLVRCGGGGAVLADIVVGGCGVQPVQGGVYREVRARCIFSGGVLIWR